MKGRATPNSLLAAVALAEHAAALRRILATAEQAARAAETLRGPELDAEERAVVDAAVAEVMADWGDVA